MEKNIKWSILIWSIFLITFVSFSFTYISLKIQAKITQNTDGIIVNTSLREENITKQLNNYILKNDEKITFLVENTNTWFLVPNTGGPFQYIVYSEASITSSWYIKDNIVSVPIQTKLEIINLGWLSQMNVQFWSNTGVILPYEYKKIYQDVGGISVLKEFFQYETQ